MDRRQYGGAVILAGTPKSWPVGPSMSTLDVLLVFVGIPLLVILAVSLLVSLPGWLKGPRYRPGQSWEATSEWFGDRATGFGTTSAPSGGLAPAAGTTPAGAGATALDASSQNRPSPNSGGASAGW